MKKVFTLLIAFFTFCNFAISANYNVKLYTSTATAVGALATSSEALIGAGAWKPNPAVSKTELYLPLSVLGTFKIDDIARLEFSTKKALPVPATPNLDFYWTIYTVGTTNGWYNERLTSEPMYYNGYNAPYSVWSTYTTNGATNQMTFFNSKRSPAGYSGAPTLADLQAGSINYNYTSPYWTTGSGIDYGAETVKYMSLSTGSGTNALMISYLDGIVITLNNGDILTIDLEAGSPQPLTSIGSPIPSSCGTLDVPVTVKNFSEIGAISAVLNFDETKLQLLPIVEPPFQGVTVNSAISLPIVSGDNTIGQFRFSTTPDPAIMLADDAVLFTLHFNVLTATVGGTTTPLTWSTVSQECEYAGPGGSPTYVSTFNNGSVTIPTRPVVNTTSGNAYCKIQEAITAATAGDIITVAAGTYAENIVVNKAITLLGPNADNSGCGSRVAEAIIVPAISSPFGEIIKVQASNVTIKGFTIDGDNTALAASLLLGTNGATLDAAEAVTVYVDNVNNLTVSNNVIQNLTYYGVTLYGASFSAPSTTGHLISNNLFRNLGTYTDPEPNANNNMNFWGGGVLLYNNQYAAVTNNCMTNVRIGIQTGNYSTANTGLADYQVISGNSIEARRRGIFHNLFYSAASPYTLSGNTITAKANSNETAFWDGILLCSMQQTASFASNNTINGADVTGIPTIGISVWNCQVAPIISNGNISGVGLGINVNNYESYPSTGSNADNTLATIDGVAISGTTIAGVKIHDNPLNTNGSRAFAEIKNLTITTSPTGIWVVGPESGANIHDNTISASAAGINVNGTVTSATNGLAISNNQVTLTSQLAGSTPTVGIALSKVSGTAGATVSGNTIKNSFIGYNVYALSTSPVTNITGGTITGIMMGVVASNLENSLRAPSTLGVSNMSISGFAGTGSFQAGVYVYTGGAVANTSITATVDKVTVIGTGKTQQDAAGLSFADFSTVATAGQNITVTECTLTDNLNRGINIRGLNAVVEVATSTLTGNGKDPYGIGGNDGFGIIVRQGATANVHNNFITNPASVEGGYNVSALCTDPGTAASATINAHQNSLSKGGNVTSWLANNSSGTLDATCNWLGSTVPAINAAAVSGTVLYNPWLCSGVDQNPAAGFQGVPCNSGAPAVPVNGALSVECLSLATPPATPEVKDVDGITNLAPVLVSTVDAPNPLICEGTRTYTYSYTNCSGISALWSFVYTIDHVTAPVVPGNGGSVVECISAITTPTPPTGIVDVCGAPVLAVAALVPFVDAPDPITCQGTRTYSFTYTDCSGLVSTWNYVYTIKHLTAPAEVGGPVANASTVECVSAAVEPTVFPVVKDVCGNVVSPTGAVVKKSVYVTKFDEAVTLSASAGPGVWYTDRYSPAGFATASFDGGNRLKHSILATDGASSRPPAYSSAFYNTQGRKYDLGAATDAIEVKLYIPADWATSNKRMAGLWGTAFNASNAVSGYPIIEFTSDGGVARFRAYETGTGAWINMGLPAGFAYNSWVTLKIKLLPNGEFLYNAGSLSCISTTGAPDASVKIVNVILQGHNYDPVTPTNGVTYDIYWDDFTWNDTYAAITCEGAVSYTYNYADCAGLAYAWTYTYTIDDNTAPIISVCAPPVTVHMNDGCTATGVVLGTPTATDNCGGAVTFTNNAPAAFPVGETTVVWKAKDCAGNESTCNQVVTVVKNAVSGTLVYNNTPKTPMNLVKMVIKQAGVQVGAEVTTSGTGAFSFPDLCAGTYTIHITDNQKDAGGINATDAAQVNAWSANFGQIEHVKFLAGDVAAPNKFITSADALKIQGYFVFPGNVAYAITPKWSYWKKGEKITNNTVPYPSTNPWPTDITVTVAGDVPNLELYGMLTGDFDGSLVPTMAKSADPSLTLAENSNLQVGANQAFELPLRAASAMQVGAVSMILDIPSELVTVKNVKINGSNDPVMWAVNGNELRIGWHSMNPVNVAENGALVTLELMATSAFAQGRTLDIALPFNPLNELADGNFEAMEYAKLMVAKVGNQTVGNIAIDNNGGLLFNNYPNPFSKVTTLAYNLPVDGKVTINLFNNLGQLVSVLVDADQTAGQHMFRYESNALQPGIYVAKLRLVNSETDMVGTIKLSVQK